MEMHGESGVLLSCRIFFIPDFLLADIKKLNFS